MSDILILKFELNLFIILSTFKKAITSSRLRVITFLLLIAKGIMGIALFELIFARHTFDYFTLVLII